MMHGKREENRRGAVHGIRRALGVLCVLLLVAYLATALAAESGAVFLFPFEGFRFEAPQGARVLTQHNLREHAAFLAGLGADEATVLAAMQSSNAIMEVFPAEGGQIGLTLAGAEGITNKASPRIDDQTRNALLVAYANMPRYREVGFSEQEPGWVRMVFSTQQGGLPVFTLRYITVAHGQQYLLSSVLIGREPEEADDAQVLDVIKRISFLVAPATPMPTPTPGPTPVPTFTPKPTPGAAMQPQQESAGELLLVVDTPPAWVDRATLTITGMVDPKATVRLLLNGQSAGEAKVRSNGAFSVSGTLPQTGDYQVTIQAAIRGGATASQTYAVRMEAPKLWLHISEPTDVVTRGDSMVKGKTEPGARIDIRGSMTANVRANDRGDFSFRIKLPNEGVYSYALTVSLKGYDPYETSVMVVREFTKKEALNAFRKALVPVDYGKLLRDPEAYAGKRASYRVRVAAIGDMDGTPCLLLQARLKSGWGEPVWALCEGAPPFGVGDAFLAYVQFTGQIAPYTDPDGGTTAVPVADLRFYVD